MLVNEIKCTPTQLAYLALREKGLSQREAEKLAGCSQGYGSQIDSKVGKRFDLCADKRVASAVKLHDKALKTFHRCMDDLNSDDPETQNKALKILKTLKFSDANVRIDSVVDRFSPKKTGSQGDGPKVSYTRIDINLIQANETDITPPEALEKASDQ